MNKRGKVVIGILIVMVVIVLTSAIVLFLVKSGAVEVRDVSTEPVLNAEFIPVGGSGHLAIREFQFCGFVDDDFECLFSRNEFERTENVYVRFVVETSVYNDDIMISRNYRIKDPNGEIILELDQKNSYSFEMKSNTEIEPVVFTDYFIMDEDSELGEYTLDIIVENPLLDKKVTLSKKFNLVEMYFEGD